RIYDWRFAQLGSIAGIPADRYCGESIGRACSPRGKEVALSSTGGGETLRIQPADAADRECNRFAKHVASNDRGDVQSAGCGCISAPEGSCLPVKPELHGRDSCGTSRCRFLA